VLSGFYFLVENFIPAKKMQTPSGDALVNSRGQNLEKVDAATIF